MRVWLLTFCLLSGAIGAASNGPGAGGSEPGTSTLRIVVDGDRMAVRIDGAAGNFIGFPETPASPEETARLAQTLNLLRAGNNLFLTPPEADCRMVSAAVSPPAYGTSIAGEPAAMTASWDFRCSNPAALLWVDARILATFPATTKLATSITAPAGQKAVVLTPGTPRVLLPRTAPIRH